MNRRLFTAKPLWLAFALHTALVATAALLSDNFPHHAPAGFINPNLSDEWPFALKFIKWDAHWYTYLAEHGYTSQTIVFFPAIILLIRLIAGLGLSYDLAGLLLCNLFTLLSFCLLYALFRLDFPPQVCRRALLAYAVMPTSFFLNSIYTEPLFLVFAVGCLYCARLGQWWPAGILAALAAMTRSLGIFLFPVLAYECWLAYRQERKLNLSMASLLLAPFALLTFMAYNYFLAADPVAFISSQRWWGRMFNPPWDNINNNLTLTFSGAAAEPGVILDSFLVLGWLAGLAFLTGSSACRIRTSYLIIGWLWLIIPLYSTSPIYPLYSMSRFVLVIFPLYLLLAHLPRFLFYCYATVSAAILFLCTALFINWHWLG